MPFLSIFLYVLPPSLRESPEKSFFSGAVLGCLKQVTLIDDVPLSPRPQKILKKLLTAAWATGVCHKAFLCLVEQGSGESI